MKLFNYVMGYLKNHVKSGAKTLALFALLITGNAVLAEDIDLFMTSASTAVDPNILFHIDNSANWNSSIGGTTKKEMLHEALLAVLTHPDMTDRIEAGLMTYASGNGGKVIEKIAPLTELQQYIIPNFTLYEKETITINTVALNSWYRISVGSASTGWTTYAFKTNDAAATTADIAAGLMAKLPNSSWTTRNNGDGSFAFGPKTAGEPYLGVRFSKYAGFTNTGDISTSYAIGDEKLPSYNNAPLATSFEEIYRYFTGGTPEYGVADGDHDASVINGSGDYINPRSGAGRECAKSFVIVLGNGAPPSNEDNDAEAHLRSHGGVLAGDPIPLTPDNYQSNWADEFARYMATTDLDGTQDGQQTIATYVIDIHDPDSNQNQTQSFLGERALLKSMAVKGKGRYFIASDAASIVEALLEILNEIQSVNSVFASTTLPVSVNVRGTNLNQIYMGVFRPDGGALPLWMGNLKLYTLAKDTNGNIFLADKDGAAAGNPTSGFINSASNSYWTTASTYWDFDPRGTPLSGSDSPDGDVVEKGGTAQQMRNQFATGRNVYTCTGACTNNSSLSGFSFNDANTNITQAALGAADAAERTAIIDWAQGADNKDEDNDADLTEVRPSVHGDVLHSRPAVINYNRYGNDNDVVIFYGSNDGIFHAIRGGTAAATTGFTPGEEIWGFIAPEFFGKLKRLRDETPLIPTAASANTPRDYFFDGEISSYQDDVNGDGQYTVAGGDKVYLFIGMRRGGRTIYALDVTDPQAPKFMWKRSNTDTGYGEMGQTWSEPAIGNVNIGGTATLVLMMGAGYDSPANDADPQIAATMGRGIMVINALTGDVIWQAGNSPSGATHNVTVAGMDYSIPSNLTILNRIADGNRYDDRLYVGDTGGNIWKVDIEDPDPANWIVRKFASVPGSDATPRKFLFRPDVVYTPDYDAVLIGSGDREHPLQSATAVSNRFYMFKDDTDTSTIGDGDLYDVTPDLVSSADAGISAQAEIDLGAARGWRLDFNPREQIVGSALTIEGYVYFGTNEPKPPVVGSCSSNLGTARAYRISYLTGAPPDETTRYTEMGGGGFLPSPVFAIIDTGDGPEGAVCIGPTCTEPEGSSLAIRDPIYWNKEID